MNDSLDEKNNDLNWIQEPEYIDIDNFGHDQGWHPKLTQEQIAFALSKDIYEPKGDEYEQFLMELGLEPIGDDELVKPEPVPVPGPIPTPVPRPEPVPVPGPVPTPVPRPEPVPVPGPVPTPVPRPEPVPVPGPVPTPVPRPEPVPVPGPIPTPVPRPEPVPVPGPVPTPVPRPEPVPVPGPVPTPVPRPEPVPVPGPVPTPVPRPEPVPVPGPVPTPVPRPEPVPVPGITPTPVPIPPVPPIDPIELPEEEEKLEEEEDFVKVVRVEKKFKNHITPWLCGAAVALILASGLSIDKPIKQVDVQTSSIVVTQQLQYSLTEQLKEFGYEDKLIESMVYKFAADYNFSIGDSMNLNQGTDAYYYGNETGKSVTIGGKYPITGFCLYSPSDANNKYEYSFYEDRALDGTPDRTNVDGITNKVNVSIDDFLSKLDSSNYNLDDVRFSLCFGHKGWVDFSDLISINEEKQQVNVQELVEICKDGATYEGIQEDTKSNCITITSADGSNIQIPIVDEENKQLPNGSRVLGSDGREYVISSLETVTEEKTETITTTESIEGDSKLKWNILDCELAVGLAPLALAAGFAIASKLKNEKYKKDPNFFEFENKEDYENFKYDFEQARKQRTSKFRQTMKRIFYGEELHVSKDLSEDQIEELYTRITTTHNDEYSYKPTDQIRFKNGQIYAVSQDESVTNLTPLVHDIGVKNQVSAEGLLTENIVEQYGGGHAK